MGTGKPRTGKSTTRSTGRNADVQADDALLSRLAQGGKPSASSNLEKLLAAAAKTSEWDD